MNCSGGARDGGDGGGGIVSVSVSVQVRGELLMFPLRLDSVC